MAFTKGMKTVEESRTEFIKLLKYEDINGQNRLFGGKLMAWIDEAAAVAAMRHAGGNVTTCAVDDLRFKKGAYLNDLLVLIARVTYVGNTSMEVRVDTYLEDLATGMRSLINHAYLVEVRVDGNGSPIPVEYGLELKTATEKMEWEGAKKRIAVRKQRRQEGF